MAKGNTTKGSKGQSGGAGMKAKGGGARKGPPGGKPDKKRSGGAKGDASKAQYGKGAGTPGGKPKKRHATVHGSAPVNGAVEEDIDMEDEGLGEGLDEYAGYSNFLLDMDAEKLKPAAAKAAEGQESRKEKKKRKAEERDAKGRDADAGGMDKGSDEEDSDEDEETQYESRPRKSAKWAEKKAEMLPVKGADGKWSIPEKPKQPAPEVPDTVFGHVQSDSEDDLDEEMDDDEAEEAAAAAEQRIREIRKIKADPRLEEAARFQARQQGIADAQETIAKTCAGIVENPEESGHRLLALHEFYPDGVEYEKRRAPPLEDCNVVKKMLLLSQLAVFKDIVPGYKVRSLSDEEAKQKVSKEVGTQRDYENMLLSMYQKYLQRLHAVASCLNKQKSTKAQVALGMVSVKCLCDLTQSLHHFNYSSNIVETLIPMLDSQR